MSSHYKYITYNDENRRALITINRPEVYNALNVDAKLELVQAIREANKNPQVLSIILTANGKAFCTGQDLNDRHIQSENGAVDLGHTLETEWHPLINAIRDSKKIIIGAINGVCAGAGVSLALTCDMLVAQSETKFVGAFSKLGLAPDAGSTFLFTRAMGYHKTMEFFLLGEPLLASDLHQYGMVNRLTDQVLEEAEKIALNLAGLAPLSMELIKKNVKCGLELDYKQSMEREKNAQRFLGNSKDYTEGLKAFKEKRAPVFTGH